MSKSGNVTFFNGLIVRPIQWNWKTRNLTRRRTLIIGIAFSQAKQIQMASME